MPRQWTDNQRTAIETLDRDVCVSAGAGSGKTGVLVERFLRIVRGSLDGTLPPEQRADVGEILVITFTEKATREMKERIVEALTSAGLVEQRRALEAAYISTIHGFCSRMLKENPFEAGVDPEFTVLDETEAARLLHAAFEREIERAYALGYSETTELVGAAQDERVFGRDLRDPLAALEDSVRAALNRVRGAGWRREELWEEWSEDPDRFYARIRAPVVELVNDLTRAIQADRAALALAGRGVLGAVELARQNVLQRIDGMEEIPEASSWDRLVETLARVGEVGKAALKGARGRAGASEAESRIRETLDRIRVTAESARDLRDLMAEREEQAELFCQRFWGLSLAVWAGYDELKQDRGVLDNNDLQSEAVQVLATNPEVLQRYRTRLRYIMVDEFQDTNPLQMRLVRMLHGEGIERSALAVRAEDPTLNTQHATNLFIVGDIQQSIYAFRNADPTIFQGEARRYRGGEAGVYVPLTANFRSRPEILQFVDYLFAQVWRGSPTPFQALEAGARFGPKPGPSLEFLVARDTGRPHYVAQEARALAARIRQIVEQRHIEITDCAQARRPVGYQDIAVLLRQLSDIERYESVFLEEGVPYFVVGGGRGYYARREIRDIMNVLTVFDTPLDDLALAAVLRSPMVGLNTETIYALSLFARKEKKHGHLYPAIAAFLAEQEDGTQDIARLRGFFALAEELRREADRLPVGLLLERVVTRTQYDARLLVRPNGRRRLANVRKLLQMANASSTHGVADFIRRLREIERLSDREGDAPTEEEKAEVVRIMTIHKAKGLEFPVVILADMGRSLGHPEQSLFTCDARNLALGCKMGDYRSSTYRTIVADRARLEREEANRLLYVAVTRAREHLILCGSAGGRRTDSWAEVVFGHMAVTVPAAPETRLGPGGVNMRVVPMTALTGGEG